jgi:hypothetical protein
MAGCDRRPTNNSEPVPGSKAGNPSAKTWLALALIVLGAAALRVRFLDVPLERDEGEYAYMGQLILRGELPYAQAYNMKFPGVYYAYAGILAAFGETARAIRLGLLVVNAASTVLLFLLALRLLGAATALATAAVFALLSLSQSVLGFTANAEHFVILPMLAGTLLLLRGVESGRRRALLGAGVLYGLAMLMKQHGAAFVAFGGCVLLARGLGRDRPPWRRTAAGLLVFAGGALLPFALLCLYLWAAGAFPTFWFWTFTYAGHYATMSSWAEGLGRLVDTVFFMVRRSLPLWALVVLGAALLPWDPLARGRRGFLGLFAGFSFLAVCPGLLFRYHYFLLFLPAGCLLAGLAVTCAGRLGPWRPRLAVVVPVLVAVLALGGDVCGEAAYLFAGSPRAVARAVYSYNPFPEAADLGKYLRAHTSPRERIAVIGSEPQIYFYAGRRAATAFIYTYALMEPHPYADQMQRDMIAQIEAATPRFIVFVNHIESWFPKPTSPRRIFRWARRYLREHYRVAEVIPIPRSKYSLTLFEALRGG